MSKSLIRNLALAAALVGLALLFLNLRRTAPEPPFEDAFCFRDTTNILFLEREMPAEPDTPQPERKRFTLSASNEVVRFVSAIRLQRKQPCPCQPHFEATFQKPSGQIHVSFCDHCFDVLDGKDGHSYEGARLYRMPKEFYREFRQVAQTREKWGVPEP